GSTERLPRHFSLPNRRYLEATQGHRQLTLLVWSLPVPVPREPLLGARQKFPTAIPARETDDRELAAAVRSAYVCQAQEVERTGPFLVCAFLSAAKRPKSSSRVLSWASSMLQSVPVLWTSASYF